MQSQSMADRIALSVWGDRIHLANRAQRFFQGMNTLGVNAVIIRNQDNHDRISAESQQKGKAITTATAFYRKSQHRGEPI